MMTEQEHRDFAQAAIDLQAIEGTECKLPTGNWRCTRMTGHEGPCAAWPTDANGRLMTYDEYQELK